MYEYLGQFKPVYTMEPAKRTEPCRIGAVDQGKSSNSKKAESFFEVTITEEQVREQVKIMNNVRRAMKEFYSRPLPERFRSWTGFVQGAVRFLLQI